MQSPLQDIVETRDDVATYLLETDGTLDRLTLADMIDREVLQDIRKNYSVWIERR